METFIKEFKVIGYDFFITIEINDNYRNTQQYFDEEIRVYEENKKLSSYIKSWKGLDKSYSKKRAFKLINNNLDIKKQLIIEYNDFTNFIEEQIELLLALAKNHFELSILQSDSRPLRTHLESVYKQTGIKPDQLQELEFPFIFEHLWKYFSQLNNARSSNGFGLNSLSYTEIYAWSQLTNSEVTPKELDILKQLDYLYLTVNQKKDK